MGNWKRAVIGYRDRCELTQQDAQQRAAHSSPFGCRHCCLRCLHLKFPKAQIIKLPCELFVFFGVSCTAQEEEEKEKRSSARCRGRSWWSINKSKCLQLMRKCWGKKISWRCTFPFNGRKMRKMFWLTLRIFFALCSRVVCVCFVWAWQL